MTDSVFDLALEKRFTDSEEITSINVTSGDTLLIRNAETGVVMRLPFSTLTTAISSAFGASFASLVDGKVPASQLPSYVDDVLEYANVGAFPATGESGKIYVSLATNLTYRWSGSAYVEISASPGSTDAVPEGGSNLYFTQARARSAVSASGSLSYNPTTGVFSFTDAVTSVAGKTGAVTLTKADVGLSNVDNTADASKSVSYAASAGSAPASDVYAWAKASTKPSYSKSEVGLGNVDNTSDANKPVSTAQQAALDAKLNVANTVPSGAAIQSDESEVIRTGFHLAGGANLDISTKAFGSTNKWRLIVIGAFANNYDGGGLTNLPCFIELTETSNTIAAGATTLTFTRNGANGKINVANSNASYAVQFTGTIFVVSYKQGATPTESMRLVNSLSVGKFGCNGATPQAKATLNAASTDLATVVSLCNQIRTLLINNGMAQ